MDRIHDILNSVNQTLANAAKTQKSKESEKLKAEIEMDDYQESFYEMSVGSLRAIAAHAQDILNNLENNTVKNNLTAPHLQGIK